MYELLTAHSTVADAARELAKAGLPVFPCAPDKKPLVSQWQKRPAPTPDEITDWLRKFPELTLGLPCGAAGLLVIDLDRVKAQNETDGIENFAKLCKEHGTSDMASQTLCARTPSGGMHLYFLQPRDTKFPNTAAKLAEHIDTRGHGGYVLIPPSATNKGRYEWHNIAPIAPLPKWLADLLNPQRRQTMRPAPKPRSSQDTRERRYFLSVLESEASAVASALHGTRNETLNRAAFALGQYCGAGYLKQAEIEDRLYEAAISNGLPPGEIIKTIASGLKKGIENPKSVNLAPTAPLVPHEATKTATTQSKESSKPNENLDAYKARLNAKRLLWEFTQAAIKYAQTAAISTGFPSLDNLLDGGLYPGLYVLGAITSLGKTTFALQAADHVAANGHDVVIFSQEMARFELIAKSLSRLTASKADDSNVAGNIRTARQLLCPSWVNHCNQESEKDIFFQLIDRYAPISERVYIHEGNFNMNAQYISDNIDKHIRITGNTPLVIVDYLQILSPLNERYSDKQNIDSSVVKLKLASNKHSAPIIVVSSFNREAYSAKAALTAFKESGGIEYAADVVIGMHYSGIDEKAKDKQEQINKAMKKYPREVELAVLKNRHGNCGNVSLKFYPKTNRFTESATQPETRIEMSN